MVHRSQRQKPSLMCCVPTCRFHSFFDENVDRQPYMVSGQGKCRCESTVNVSLDILFGALWRSGQRDFWGPISLKPWHIPVNQRTLSPTCMAPRVSQQHPNRLCTAYRYSSAHFPVPKQRSDTSGNAYGIEAYCVQQPASEPLLPRNTGPLQEGPVKAQRHGAVSILDIDAFLRANAQVSRCCAVMVFLVGALHRPCVGGAETAPWC